MSAHTALDGSSDAPAPVSKPAVHKSWWFWTALGTVVAASAVTGVMVAN
jgi:hypothetical protein